MDKTGTANSLLRLFILFAALLAVAAPAQGQTTAAQPQQEKSVAILPFKVNAARDLSYLTDGIRDMLASRLAAGGGAVIIEKKAVDAGRRGSSASDAPDSIRTLGTALHADYLISGSVTAIGNSLSIDAKVFAVSGDATGPRSFYANAANEDDIIQAIDQLAKNIGAEVFGQKAETAAAAQQVPALPGPTTTPYQTAHPERQFMAQEGGAYGINAPLVRPMGVTSPLGFTKSQNFQFGLYAMDVGDVDGDNQDEFVLASQHAVRIYKRAGSRFNRVAEITSPDRYTIHALTLADLNRNGRKEIYVSAADPETPNSFALEWDGKEFAYVFNDLHWYIRALDMPGEGVILAGQKPGLSKILTPGLYRLNNTESGIVPGAKLSLPNVNLFDFSMADLDADGQPEIVVINQSDKLLVLRANGKLLWVSDEYYGGTTKYLGGENYEDIDAYHEHGLEAQRIYVPTRIIIRDINNDGLPDVIVNKNLSSASRLMSRFKSYPSGEIHALTWNGIGLTELWHTRKIDGYIADYQLGPVVTVPTEGGDKTIAELFVGTVLRSGGLNILSSSDSTVLMYQLDLTEEQKKE